MAYSRNKADTLSFIFRLLLGGIYLIAGLAKIADPPRFLLTLREFQLFPDAILRFLAVYLPWLEFILGLFLVLGILYKASAFILTFLTAIFTFAILSVIARGMEIDCGCFGLFADVLKLPDSADFKAVFRDLVFIAMGVYIVLAKATSWSLEEYIRNRSG